MNAEETVLLTLHKLEGKMISLIVPTVEFVHFFEDSDNKISELILPIEIDANQGIEVGEMLTGIYFDASNDPTPFRAGGVISLGYYTLRIGFKFCTISSLSPLTFTGYGGDENEQMIEAHFTRPLRRVTP